MLQWPFFFYTTAQRKGGYNVFIYIGKGACLPCLPAVGGDEGVGNVVEIGKLVSAVEPGERVLLTSRLLGTWRYYGIYHERDVHVISDRIPLAEASMLAVNPCMAYRMIKDFRQLCPGDVVVQNAANSPCGQCVIQLCKQWGLQSVNIVANHSDFEAVKRHLLCLGATEVYTLEEAEELCSFKGSFQRPALALNCLGGRFEDVLLRLVECNGTIVYYGFAYDLPMVKRCCRPDVKFYKFHLVDWQRSAPQVVQDKMINNLSRLMAVREFAAPVYEVLELKNFIHAFRNTSHCEAYSTRNYVFDFTSLI